MRSNHYFKALLFFTFILGFTILNSCRDERVKKGLEDIVNQNEDPEKKPSNREFNIQSIKEFTVSREEVVEYEKRYLEERYRYITQELEPKEAREVWFSVKQLKHYLNYIEYLGYKNDYKELGLRFYFGVNPKGKTTLVGVPTTQSQVKPGSIRTGSLFAKAQVENQNMDDDDVLYINHGSSGHPPKAFASSIE